MSVYLLRHGQTDWNKRGIIQGRYDTPLNDTGREQAQKAHNELLGIPLDRCYCSPLSRAKETAQIALAGRDIPFVYDDRLVEMAYGDYEGTDWRAGNYQKERRYLSHRFPKGESYFDVAHRAFTFLDEIKDYAKDHNVIIVCHGGIARTIEAYFNRGGDNDFFIDNICPNGGVRKYEYEERVIPPVMPLPKE